MFMKRLSTPTQRRFLHYCTGRARFGNGGVYQTTLRVAQDRFSCDGAADEFYAGSEVGWRDTFAGIRNHLSERQKISYFSWALTA